MTGSPKSALETLRFLDPGGLLLGHVLAIATIDRAGRLPLQILGFGFLTVLLSVLGWTFRAASVDVIVALLCLCNMVSNWDPNTTTFVLSAELFPTRYRATIFGIAAASGKISQALFGRLEDHGDPTGLPPQHVYMNSVIKIFALFTYPQLLGDPNSPSEPLELYHLCLFGKRRKDDHLKI